MKPSGCWSTFTPALGVTGSPPRAAETQCGQETFDPIPAVPGHVHSDMWMVPEVGEDVETGEREGGVWKRISVPSELLKSQVPSALILHFNL